MCDCASCKYTDGFSSAGFVNWPRGEPAGARASAKAYSLHAQPMPKPWRYVSRPPQFNTAGLVMPIAPAPAYVHRWINGPTAYKSKGPVLPGPDARPDKPAKARQHFHELNRQPEAARIYAMPKTQPKRQRGRPAIPGRRVVIKLEERLIKRAEELGGGKVARGIRKALERKSA